MLEQRFLITIANEDNSISFNVTVRSKQFIRSLSILVASHLNVFCSCISSFFLEELQLQQSALLLGVQRKEAGG